MCQIKWEAALRSQAQIVLAPVLAVRVVQRQAVVQVSRVQVVLVHQLKPPRVAVVQVSRVQVVQVVIQVRVVLVHQLKPRQAVIQVVLIRLLICMSS